MLENSPGFMWPNFANLSQTKHYPERKSARNTVKSTAQHSKDNACISMPTKDASVLHGLSLWLVARKEVF